MLRKGLECLVSELANSDTCPTPATHHRRDRRRLLAPPHGGRVLRAGAGEWDVVERQEEDGPGGIKPGQQPVFAPANAPYTREREDEAVAAHTHAAVVVQNPEVGMAPAGSLVTWWVSAASTPATASATASATCRSLLAIGTPRMSLWGPRDFLYTTRPQLHTQYFLAWR
jgi:hypothetical protein